MTTKSRPTRFPVGVVVAAAIALTFMIIWSAVHWSQMAPTIVTREAGGNHGASIVSRGFSAAAMPGTLALTSSLLTISPWVHQKFSSLTGIPLPRYDRSAARVLTAVQAGLGLVMCTAHVFIVDLHTAAGIPAVKLMAMSLGALFVLLGVYFPIAQTDVETNNAWIEAFVVAQRSLSRSVGIALAGVGLATIAVAATSPWRALAIGGGGMVAISVVFLVICLVKANRLHGLKHRHP